MRRVREALSGYGTDMTEMSGHRPPVEIPDVPQGEQISPADA